MAQAVLRRTSRLNTVTVEATSETRARAPVGSGRESVLSEIAEKAETLDRRRAARKSTGWRNESLTAEIDLSTGKGDP